MAVSLTDSARERVSSFLRSRGHGIGLRLGVKKTGCSGFAYVINYADDIAADDVVFETGTDCGYHAAILTRLAKKVYSVEISDSLAAQAKERLARLGYNGIEVQAGDGFYGWAGKAPFDVIIVKEAVQDVPPPLLNQLKPGGRLVAPVGPLDQPQILKLVTKDRNGRIRERARVTLDGDHVIVAPEEEL